MAKKITTIYIDEEILERGKQAVGEHSLSLVLSTLLKAWLDGKIKNVVILLEPLKEGKHV